MPKVISKDDLISEDEFLKLAQDATRENRKIAKTRLIGLLASTLGDMDKHAGFYKFIGDLLSNDIRDQITWEFGWNGKLSYMELMTLTNDFLPIREPLYSIVQAINCNNVQQLADVLENDKYADYQSMFVAITWLYTCAMHKAQVAEVGDIINYIQGKGLTVGFVRQDNGDLRIADVHVNAKLQEAFELIRSSKFIKYSAPTNVTIPSTLVSEFAKVVGGVVIMSPVDVAVQEATAAADINGGDTSGTVFMPIAAGCESSVEQTTPPPVISSSDN